MSTSDIRDKFYRLKAQMIEEELGPVKFKILLYFIDQELPIPKIATALGIAPFSVVCVSKILAPMKPKIHIELRDLVPRSPVQIIYHRDSTNEDAA
jgi:hypothetical protein